MVMPRIADVHYIIERTDWPAGQNTPHLSWSHFLFPRPLPQGHSRRILPRRTARKKSPGWFEAEYDL